MLLQHHNDQRNVNNVSIVRPQNVHLMSKKKNEIQFVLLGFYSLDELELEL